MVLAGGAATRMGGSDKPAQEIDGVSLLDRVIAAVPDAERVVVVGPERETEREVVWCREDPPGSGPVAAIAAGLPNVEADYVVVLAADLPAIGPAVPELLRAIAEAPDADVAALADGDGRLNYLAAAWRSEALHRAIRLLGRGVTDVSMRTLFAGTDQVKVADRDGWGIDCDTWADLEAADLEAARRRTEQGSAS